MWTLVEILVERGLAELLCDRLWSLGAQGIEELADDAAHPGAAVFRTRVGPDAARLEDLLSDDFPGLVVKSVEIPQVVADGWRSHVSPTWVDDDHVVAPSWLAAPEARVVVRIEPGDQFGLGNHESTVLAGRLLLGAVGHGARWLDLGCGSGVLAILAARSSGASFLVTDIASGAAGIAMENARANDCAEQVTWIESLDSVADSSLDGVVANILAPVLRDVAEQVLRVVRPGGLIVLSGILSAQLDDVVRAYGRCSVVARAESGMWAAVTLRPD